MMHARAAAALAGVLAAVTAAGAASADEPALPFVASVARIRIEASRSHLVVVHDVNLARGAWQADDLDVFVAFGAPGAPRALEAWLVPVAPGALEAGPGERGASLAWSYARRRPPTAIPLLGRPTMAGVVVQLPSAALARALQPSAMATLRLRSLESLPAASADDGARDVVVRLGEAGGAPLVLGRVEVATAEADFIDRVEARLCRGASLGDRVAVRLVAPATPGAAAPRAREEGVVAPVLAPRKSGEDLCVRIYTRTQKSGSAVAAPES